MSEPDRVRTRKEVVDKDRNDLNLKSSDAMDPSKWRECWEGIVATVTETVRPMNTNCTFLAHPG